MKNAKTGYLVKVAMLSAIAFLLQMLVPFKVGGFLDVELSDYAAIIGSFALGPLAGVLIELIKNIFHLSVSTTSFIGELANFLINGSFVLIAGLIYKKEKCRKNAVIGLVCATIIMPFIAALANWCLLLPMYMPTAPFDVKIGLILSTITPFNLVRGTIVSLLTVFTYKHISPILHKY